MAEFVVLKVVTTGEDLEDRFNTKEALNVVFNRALQAVGGGANRDQFTLEYQDQPLDPDRKIEEYIVWCPGWGASTTTTAWARPGGEISGGLSGSRGRPSDRPPSAGSCGHALSTKRSVPRFNTAEKLAHFGLPVPTVPAEGTDAGQLASLRPTGDGLGVDAEERSDLCRGQQRLWCRRVLYVTTGGHSCHLTLGTLPAGPDSRGDPDHPRGVEWDRP